MQTENRTPAHNTGFSSDDTLSLPKCGMMLRQVQHNTCKLGALCPECFRDAPKPALTCYTELVEVQSPKPLVASVERHSTKK